MMLKREQRSIPEGKESRQIRGRNNKQPVLKAEITNLITSSTTTVYTQEEIAVAAVLIPFCVFFVVGIVAQTGESAFIHHTHTIMHLMFW